jgi:hypothetical protein
MHVRRELASLVVAISVLFSSGASPARQGSAARAGVVHQDGRSFADAGGKFLSLGTTLFWALWGATNDRERFLSRNLEPIARAGFQDVRVILVLPASGLWAGRRVDPFAERFAADVGALVDLAGDRYGMRTAVCIFGGRVGTADQHADIVARVIGALRTRASKITHVEIANEGGNNGFPKDELWRHAAAVRAAMPGTLVALTSTENYGPDPAAIYGGSPANMFAFHPDRDVKGASGVFEPTLEPARYREFRVPAIGENGEPRGPASSITGTNDPVVLGADALATWMSGWGRYVLHTGAGIYGLENTPDGGTPRPANWEETPGIAGVAAALATLRSALPQDLADWTRLSTAEPSRQADWPFETKAGQGWDAAARDHGTRGLAVWNGRRFLALVIKLDAPLDLVARDAMTLRVRRVTDYEVIDTVVLARGAHHTLAPAAPALILEGEMGSGLESRRFAAHTP